MSKLLTNVRLGADPELFVQDVNTKKFVPSLDLIGGNKYFPQPTAVPGYFLQEDNVLVEFNIPPARTEAEFVTSIHTGMELFKEFLPPSKYSVAIESSYNFEQSQLTDPRAFEFGCEPDRNAWIGGKFNPRPPEPKDGLRSAGGHIHIGYELSPEKIESSMLDNVDRADINRALTKWCDIYLGIPSLKMDLDKKRRTLYGKAGAYRDKDYGVEYRTLSSFWLKSDELIRWAYSQAMRAVDKVSELEILDDSLAEKIAAAINFGNKNAIDELFTEFKLEVA